MKTNWILTGVALLVAGAAFGADWPQFCGPARNNVSAETGLADSWSKNGPKVLWETEVFDGYAGPAVRDGKVYQLDRAEEKSVLRCLNLKRGKELWTVEIDDPGKMRHEQFAGTRNTPAVTEDAVYFVTGWGTLVCVDLKSEDVRWKHELLLEFGQDLNMWGMSQSPCLYEDLVIVAPASSGTGVAAFNQESGELVWKTEAIGNYTFASPVVYNICGEDMVVALGSQAGGGRRRGREAEAETQKKVSGGTYGISPKDGSILWFYDGWQGRNAIPFPTLVPDNRLFITGGYGAGSAMIQIEKSGDGFSVNELFKTKDVGPQIHQPVYLDDCILTANNGNSSNDGLTCMTLDGTVAWRTKDIDGAPTFERGSFILVDGKIVILDAKTGLLHLLKADVSEYTELASAPMVKANDMAWAPMALSDGKLLLRDWNTLKCVDLK